ncbi:MAG TPA: heme exporter protein CcmB, partial [Novosphingobium sp.]|nr:heme exporter protein CcmB [Novosphingobium sp.]
MSATFLPLLRRDLAMLVSGGRRGGAVLPVLFFLAVAMLYPFAVGPDAVLLGRT